MLNLNQLLFKARSNEMVPHIYVFRSVMVDWVLRQCNCGFVVNKQSNWFWLLVHDLTNQSCQPYPLTCYCRSCHIFGFTWGESNYILFLWNFQFVLLQFPNMKWVVRDYSSRNSLSFSTRILQWRLHLVRREWDHQHTLQRLDEFHLKTLCRLRILESF